MSIISKSIETESKLRLSGTEPGEVGRRQWASGWGFLWGMMSDR